MRTTLEQVRKFRKVRYEDSMALIEAKGHDYSREQQEDGDTLFNLRVSELTGLVDRAERGILVRLNDKMMRLQSLVLADVDPAVVEESINDTINDIHNYVDYVGVINQQRRESSGAAKPRGK